jgi:shikimate dehydrogenase
MLERYGGETRIYPIIGDPIAQVKSPVTMTSGFEARGLNAIVVPVHVAPADVDAVVRAFAPVRNVDGIIATVPHKFTAFRHAATATTRAQILGAANLLRRNPDGTWHADMVDGLSFVKAAEAAGCRFEGKRALLAGAGGAGSAIGLALLDAGVAVLAVHDASAERRETLIARLDGVHPGKAVAGSADAGGCDVVVNATPAGMRQDDPLPVDPATITASMFVGDVITAPEVTPLLAAARAKGCRTSTGIEMVRLAVAIQVDFLLGVTG